jgi:hypothetical protein
MGLIGAAGAGGYTVARSVNVPSGGHATFLQSGGWRLHRGVDNEIETLTHE